MQHIIGSRILLRQLRYEDIQAYLSVFIPPVQKALHVTSLDAEYSYICERLTNVFSKQSFFFVICAQQSRQCIGAIEIREPAYPGQLYCWLHTRYWGQQYLQEALALAERYYFLQTDRLYFTARVDIDNKRSYKALKKCGFAHWRIVNGPHGKQYELILRNAIL